LLSCPYPTLWPINTKYNEYRSSQKTYILISLRENKQRGDRDEFHMEWNLREAFRRTREQWETEVNHRTRKLLVRLIFPKPRPPVRVWLEEQLRRRTRLLSDSALKQLAAGPAAATCASFN
jgi:hypothetical protein